ncbi:MAG TPA: MFS transporter [Candidatus Dormibacteraeota bacterium]|nr:MFS transporter [Candidatus Dormibacteraeota bacterium]
MSQTTVARGVIEALDEAPLSRFHMRAVLTAGTGFFTDAYDLFIIGTALALIKVEYHPSAVVIGLVGSTALLAAFAGATVFGRIADVFGRKKIYGLEAAIMAVAAVGSALSPNLVWLIAWRFLLGIGIGGDYPVSAVLMSEYANRKNRGRLVSMVFSMQALGLIAGPLVALVILGLGVHPEIAWRLMLGLGAIPALAVIYLRRTLPESPRFRAQVQGRAAEAAAAMRRYSKGVVDAGAKAATRPVRLGLRQFLSNPKYLTLLLGTAGCWFMFDYAFYGNTISTPLILKAVAPHASLITDTAIALLIFTVAAAPGYLIAFLTVDRIGHRRLQFIGFAVMGLAFLAIGVVPGLTTLIVPFLLVYGISYFFTEFGPNTTTFLMASELYPVSARTTGHGISAGLAKVGAFVGTLTFPLVNGSLGLSGVMTIAALTAGIGLLLTRLLPEPSGLSLEEVSGEGDGKAELAPSDPRAAARTRTAV